MYYVLCLLFILEEMRFNVHRQYYTIYIYTAVGRLEQPLVRHFDKKKITFSLLERLAH